MCKDFQQIYLEFMAAVFTLNQILCGQVNYALGKTRMQVKKQKDTLFWIHVHINLLKILKSYCQ
jgi:hypothetical protein